ncbi:hypothetical protein DT87_17870 [Streptomyces sp. NTK 937]|nr:hypothetical protein DT87_17870 [Streptomyces sp. NTK 937]
MEILVHPHHEFMVRVTRRQHFTLKRVDLCQGLANRSTLIHQERVDHSIDILRRIKDLRLVATLNPVSRLSSRPHANSAFHMFDHFPPQANAP